MVGRVVGAAGRGDADVDGRDVEVEIHSREQGEHVIVIPHGQPDLGADTFPTVSQHVEGKHREDIFAGVGLLL